MKIAYFLNQHPYASCTFIRREIAGLEAAGVEVDRISIRPPDPRVIDEDDVRERERTRVLLAEGASGLAFAVLAVFFAQPLPFLRTLRECIRLGWRSSRGIALHLVYLAEACLLLRWLRDSGVPHVHSHFGTNATSVVMLCRMLGGPRYSFTVHGPGEFDQPQALCLREKIEHADFVVAISSFACAQLFRWCDHAQWSKVQVVHCGVSQAFLDSAPVPLPEEPRMLSVGRFGEQKGFPLLIDAAARLAQEGLDFSITLVGDGDLRPTLERMIEEYDLQDRIFLVGWKKDSEVRECMQASRVVVLPSFAEGLPVVIMEALALSRPVISTAIAGIPELVETNRCGWLVPAGSVTALADAMREAISAPSERLEAMGKLGRERVLRDHDAGVEAAKLADLIRRRNAEAGSPSRG